jgi:hypothetical protein
MRALAAFSTLAFSTLAVLAAAAPLEAQTTPPPSPSSSTDSERLSIRPFVAVARQRFSADTTFDAIFGHATGTLAGGGVLVTRGSLFVEAEISRFRRNGERAFASDEDGSGVGIPLTVTIGPVEFAAGYRLRPRRSGLVPYIGAGLGLYRYREESPAAEIGEDVNVRHAGWVVVAGLERQLHRLFAVSADLRYTHVPGILGQGGLSQAVGETNLGGIAVRLRFLLGP